MAFDKTTPIGQSPFMPDAPMAPQPAPMPLKYGVGPNARPPRLWAPLQVPQQTSDQVNLLNKTAPITSDTRPYVDDATGSDMGGLAGFGGILGGLNGG